MALKSHILTKMHYMKIPISIYDFSFYFSSHGFYTVIYQSPVTGKKWTKNVCNMYLIDITKNERNPKKVHLNDLKRLVKWVN